jgi:Pyruvate/2-oxoacid:ferredoxin oxidoreductase delta subunit
MRITRRLLQLGFLVLTLVGVFAVGGHAERWCPFGGVEALYTYASAGNLICSLGVSNFYVLGGLLVLTLLMRRAFCGYACPIGTISEWLQALARRCGLRAWQVPYHLDRGLALLKYVVLGVIVYFTWTIGELVFRGYDPCYVLISRHGTDITMWAYVVSGALVLLSLAIIVPFCRWLCPLAAVFTPFSRIGLARVRRSGETCIDCGLCRRACPMAIPVDKVAEVTAARCTSCLECVAACPKRAGGALTWGPPRFIGGHWPQAVVIGVLLLCIGGAVAATYAFPLPSFIETIGEAPAQTASLRLRVQGVNCRHSSEQFVAYLRRDDEYSVRGYLRVEAWPQPGMADVRLVYDPTRTNEQGIKRAITEPYYDLAAGAWTFSAYRIEGYDALAEP